MSLEALLLTFFCGGALLGGVLMLVARHPMRVALALIGSMLSLAGIYAVLGVHVIAVFQVLIYVGAVMVFMVYVIMLLDVRDPSFLERYWLHFELTSVLLLAAVVAAIAIVKAGRRHDG
jgi:NADH-quinone oxidoreductase subunit J